MEGETLVLHPFSLKQIGADPWIRAFLNEKVVVIPPPPAAPRVPEPVLEPQPSPLHDKRLIESGIAQLDLRTSQDTALTALRKAPQITQGIVEFTFNEHPEVEFDDELDTACAAVHPAKVLMSKRDAKKAEEFEGDMPMSRVLPVYLNENKTQTGFKKLPPILPPTPAPQETPKKVSSLPAQVEEPEPSPPPKPVVILTPSAKTFEKKKDAIPPEPKTQPPAPKPVTPPAEQDLSLASEAEEIVDIPAEEEEEVPVPKVVKKAAAKTVKILAVKPKALPPTPEPKAAPRTLLKPKPFVEEEEEKEQQEDDESDGPNSEIDGEETDVGESEPSDGEDIVDGDDEDAEADDEADYTEEKKAKTKAVAELVKMTYEQRFANNIAEVNEKFDAKETKKRKAAAAAKEKKPKRVQFTEATPQNKPIGLQSKTAPVPPTEKPKGVPTVKTAASLRRTLDECNARSTFPRITGIKTKLSPLDPIPVLFQKMFEGCWEDSVCLAITDKWPQPKSSPFWTYGDHGVECEKWVLDYVNVKALNVEAEPESAIVQRWHRMIWAYERMQIFVPPVLLDDSKCEIVLEKPMPNQTYFTEPARKITCFYIQLPAFQAMRDAIRPYEFCRREARLEMEHCISMHQGEVSADIIYQKLLTNPTTNKHRIMLYSWYNAQLLADLNFFSDD